MKKIFYIEIRIFYGFYGRISKFIYRSSFELIYNVTNTMVKTKMRVKMDHSSALVKLLLPKTQNIISM